MYIRARAPLRISFAGGGTDLSAYCNHYTGYILNACINIYAYATIKPLDNGKIIFNAEDRREYLELNSSGKLVYDGKLDLLKAVYNRIVKDYTQEPLSFELTTYADAPAGSGLGSSSTLVVAILKAFCEWLNLPLGEYDIAHLAWEIERVDLGMSGGKQDQYSAAFGGFNFMEFHPDGKVIVNPLRIKQSILNELEFNVVLFYMGNSRLSSEIIDVQARNIEAKSEKTIEAMHNLKKQAFDMKEALLKGETYKMGEFLNYGWEAKKKTSDKITSKEIDEIYDIAIKAGAAGGKISGAGGGGFFMFFCPDNSRYPVIKELEKLNKEFRRYRFTNIGVQSWTVGEKAFLQPSYKLNDPALCGIPE